MPLSSDRSARRRQLANLATPFTPGRSGNPAGRPPGRRALQPGIWLAVLGEATNAELRAIRSDPSASTSKRAAARLWLDTAEDDPNVRRRAIAEVLDRTEGKPRQRHHVEPVRAETPEQVLARVVTLAGGNSTPRPLPRCTGAAGPRVPSPDSYGEPDGHTTAPDHPEGN